MLHLLRTVKSRCLMVRSVVDEGTPLSDSRPDIGRPGSERVAVLGMLRSGTSLLTMLLERAGLHTGRADRFVPIGPANPMGFFEHTAVAGMNRLLLDSGAGDAVEFEVARSPGFPDRVAHHLPAMTEILGELEPERPWVIKHPSLCLTFGAWADAAQELSAVILVRHPAEVAESMRAFMGFGGDADRAYASWEALTTSALELTRNSRRAIVLHHELLARPEATVRSIIETLGLDLPLPADGAFDDLVRPALHRHVADGSGLPPGVDELWNRLRARDLDGPIAMSARSAELIRAEARSALARSMSRTERTTAVLVISDRTLAGDRKAALARRSWASVDPELGVDVRFVVGNPVVADDRQLRLADLRAHLPPGVELPKAHLAEGDAVAVGDLILTGTADAAARDAGLRKALLALRSVIADGQHDAVLVVDDASHVALHRLDTLMSSMDEVPPVARSNKVGRRAPVLLRSDVAQELAESIDADRLAELGYPASLSELLERLQEDNLGPAEGMRTSDYSNRPPAGHHLDNAIVTLFSPDRVSDIEWFHDRHYRHTRPALAQPAKPNRSVDDRIFIQIPSYRDPQLPKTIESALSNAADPDRIRFGICWQYDEWTSDDLEPWMDDPRVSIDEVHYPQSKGCCWARQRANEFYDGEGYFLQIDAHMRFAPGWDDRLIEMLEACPAPKPILTTYPPALMFNDDGSDRLVTASGIQRLCLIRIETSLATVQGGEMAPNTDAPGPSRFLAGGFNFSHGQLVEEVPSDPDVYFSGEEVALAARAFTHGYDLFYPHENVIWHLYAHEAPKHWTDTRSFDAIHDQAKRRMRTLLIGDHSSLGRFGLGSVRTVGDYERMAGIDFRATRLGLEHIEPTEQRVRFSLDRLLPEDCDLVVCTLLDADGVEQARIDQLDPDVLSGERTEIRARAMVVNEVTQCAVLPRTAAGFGERTVVELL